MTVPAAAHAGCCIVADNGLATATLPPLTTGATCVHLGTTEITSGLPADATIQTVTSIGNFINVVETPGGGWAVSGYLDLTHRIDFVGAPGGSLAGMSGSTANQRRFGICPENAVAVEGASWSHVKALYR